MSRAKLGRTIGQLLALAAAIIGGNFTVVRREESPDADATGFGEDPCANHGGVDWCEGSVCACQDGHVVIRN